MKTFRKHIDLLNTSDNPSDDKAIYKKALSAEGFAFLTGILLLFIYLGMQMGSVNMINTLMNTAYKLLTDTVFYIMAIAVLSGAISALLTEFGVLSIINKLLTPLMKPMYGLPGASALGILVTYLSDNPAILTLAKDSSFRKYFKAYQMPALTNIGTSFGMGLIVTACMIGINPTNGDNFIAAALIGNMGAVIGSVVSVRIMLACSKKCFPDETPGAVYGKDQSTNRDMLRKIRKGSPGERFMNAMMDGGKSGVDLGLTIIPGVLIVCTLVLIFTNGPNANGEFTGNAYEGIALLPMLGEKLQLILNPLFGFTSAESIAVPITALGAAGAAIGLVPHLVASGLATGNDVAVFTAMCMCWSGYLSTHVAMMSCIGCSNLTGKAILSHTIGGVVAGASAHWLYMLLI